MIGIMRYLLGYKIFTVSTDDVARCAEIFLKNGISVKFRKNTFTVDAFRARKIKRILSGNIEYSESELRGFGGFLYRNRKRYGVMLAIIISSLVFILSSDMVWDIRIEGCDKALEEQIKQELYLCGFGVGSKWSDTDLSELEVEFLSKTSCVSWLNINRRGTVAYITIIDKQTHEEDRKEGFSNVVADRDAVIEEITVVHGVAAVKVGDSVKKGDLLISGILADEDGGEYCYAEGVVLGRVSDSVEVIVPETRELKVTQSSRLLRWDLKFFGFSVNIFNYYGKSDNNCDIIEKETPLSLFETRLPISIVKSKAVYHYVEKIKMTQEEMVHLASSEMAEALSRRLSESTLVKIKTDGKFLDDEYIMVSDFVCIEQIGLDLPFEVKNFQRK